ncbi:MBL fold metallo-hydrolase [Geobacter sp. DSM 9736]|uniref:ribonuclease Z n=1 Tax=Geobacter sp. DSM 9736 TaxID=1277350 RepID=UPI000B4FD52C|nr:MBL fold metallo-hydrolase [Geobacter sp. DSM 9736]SNB47961.1 ribonuclease Z [Geobacter sp. DSM 9736]
MTPQFHPFLVNDPLGDPALYVDFLHERRAVLFDLGEIASLAPRKILRISHVFISHTHIDHFIGFDHLVRICLGRDKTISFYGPPGFVDQVGHRLAAYTWNLVENYPTDFTVIAHELGPDGTVSSAEFHCVRRFVREGERRVSITGGVLLDDRRFRVRSVFLDHKTPSLAFALEEKQHVGIMKNKLDELGLPVGPWLADFKDAVLRGDPSDRPFLLPAPGVNALPSQIPLGVLREQIARVVPGQKIAYVTDAVFSPSNVERILSLATGADYLFIESTFLHEEAERAAEKCHLTARQAGTLAREAAVARVVPFHFSAKYKGVEDQLRQELLVAFSASLDAP